MKNAARNVGYKAGNAPYFMRRTANRAGNAVKGAASKVKSKAKNIPNAAKEKAYKRGIDMMNNPGKYRAKALQNANVIGTAYNVGMGGLYYGHARRRGASKGQAAAVGATRAVTGNVLAGQGVGIGVRAYNSAKRRKSTKKTTSRRTRK